MKYTTIYKWDKVKKGVWEVTKNKLIIPVSYEIMKIYGKKLDHVQSTMCHEQHIH